MKQHLSSEVSSGHGFLEAPRWHDGSLWLSDFFRQHVVRISPEGEVAMVLAVEQAPSGLGFLTDGSMLVVSQRDRRILRLGADGVVSEHADLSHVTGGNANDMLVSPSGDAYVGNFGYDTRTETPRSTNLAHVHPDGTVDVVPGEVFFPNGMGILPDGSTLVLCETAIHRITAFTIGADGGLTDQRVWADLPVDFKPDGLAVDSDGGVWFGNADNSERSGFYRVEEGGELTDVILTPEAWGVACQFGGPANDVLYLVCNDTSPTRFRQGDSHGTVRRADVGRHGC